MLLLESHAKIISQFFAIKFSFLDIETLLLKKLDALTVNYEIEVIVNQRGTTLEAIGYSIQKIFFENRLQNLNEMLFFKLDALYYNLLSLKLTRIDMAKASLAYFVVVMCFILFVCQKNGNLCLKKSITNSQNDYFVIIRK